MKKLIAVFSIFSLLFISCGEEKKEESGKSEGKEVSKDGENVKLSGKIEGASNEEVKISIFQKGSQPKEIGTFKTTENGEFDFDFHVDGIGIIAMNYAGQNITLIVEAGNTVLINTNKENVIQHLKVGGTPTMDIFNGYLRIVLAKREEIIALTEKYNEALQSSPDRAETIKVEMDKIIAGIQDWIKEKITDNPDQPGLYILLNDLAPNQGLINWDEKNLAYFKSILKAMQAKYPENSLTSKLTSDINSWESQLVNVEKQKERIKRYGDLNRKIAVGEPAPDIFLDDPNGKEIKLSDFKGQIVLLDFWASWCAPCRKTNPIVVDVYHKYKDKGFTVFSVSLDEKKDKWLQAIEADGLVWESHVSDLAGWQSIAAQLYKVSSIPSTFLIDKKGIIREVRLHPSELEQKLLPLL